MVKMLLVYESRETFAARSDPKKHLTDAGKMASGGLDVPKTATTIRRRLPAGARQTIRGHQKTTLAAFSLSTYRIWMPPSNGPAAAPRVWRSTSPQSSIGDVTFGMDTNWGVPTAQRRLTSKTDWNVVALLYEGLVQRAPTTGALVGVQPPSERRVAPTPRGGCLRKSP
jgi:hypothetical protein